jgi:dihydroneopterin aldolase
VVINSIVADIEGEDLEQTIDYEKVYRLLENQMEHTASLMETVIYRFIKDCKEKFPQISNITMSMKKLNPIPGAQLNHTKIKISQAF